MVRTGRRLSKSDWFTDWDWLRKKTLKWLLTIMTWKTIGSSSLCLIRLEEKEKRLIKAEEERQGWEINLICRRFPALFTHACMQTSPSVSSSLGLEFHCNDSYLLPGELGKRWDRPMKRKEVREKQEKEVKFNDMWRQGKIRWKDGT